MDREEALVQLARWIQDIADGLNAGADRAEIAEFASELSQRLKVGSDLGRALSSPCACIDAQEVEDWIAGMSTLDDAGDRATQANALIKGLRDRKPCACRGAKVLGELDAWVSSEYLERGLTVYDPLYELETSRADKHIRVLAFDVLPGEKPCS